ncbi:MAG: 50S ribosomal protein L3 [Propionibacteriaceae bacterium]|jgi:large subunit ribosomal protein L3|nr:50S ribosomal protein L3 [Propionibacteriaceae bacterium]
MNKERKIKGIIGRKLGMTQMWDENNKVIPVTVIEAGPCVVTQIRTLDRDGYSAVQLGFGELPNKIKKKGDKIVRRSISLPVKGHFDKAGVSPRRHLMEIRTTDADQYELGSDVTAEVFAEAEVVDVIGVTKGKGTAGVMKRHGFRGLGAGHGVHRKHRSPGSIGQCATPSRIFKGTRMAGHMGVVRRTIQNLTIAKVDAERGLILVKGAIPGPKNGLVFVRSAAKKGA